MLPVLYYVMVRNMKEKLPVRKPLRMNYYDYNTPGAYFLTFCTHDRKHMLSRIAGAIHEVPIPQLTEFGKIVESVIRDVPAHLHVTVDRYVIMPNHVHLIAMVTEEDVLVPFSAEKGMGKEDMLHLLNLACEDWNKAE